MVKMYRFFGCGARYSFRSIALAALALLVGCGADLAPTPVAIETGRLQLKGCSPLPSSGAGSLVYRCQTDGEDVFMTSLRDCSSSEKMSFQATTRQLFVGLMGLKVLSQEAVSLGDVKALQSVVRGTVDADPVVMATFTFRKNGCVTDLVIWQGTASDIADEELKSTFSSLSKNVADSLIQETASIEGSTRGKG